jgi:tetratricopeptide (TPR) repeat protein
MKTWLLGVVSLMLFPSLAFTQMRPGHVVRGRLEITAKDESRLPMSFSVAIEQDILNTYARTTYSKQVKNHGEYRFDNIPYGNWVLIVVSGNQIIMRYPFTIEVDHGPAEYQIDLISQWDTGTPNKKFMETDFYQRKPENATLMDEARASSSDRNYSKAAGILRKILDSDPKDFEAWTDLGTVLFEQGNNPEAEKAYERALEEKPLYPLALLNYGKLQYAQKNYDAAIQTFSQLVGAHPESAEAHRFLGEAYLSSQRGSKAVPELEEAIRLDPEHQAEAYLSLGALYDAAGAKDRAAEVYEKFWRRRFRTPPAAPA